MMVKKYTPIQIIGTQRSGSNLLRLMLNELDGVIAPHPPHILKTFQPLLPLYGRLDQSENFCQLVDDVCRLIETNPVVWDHLELGREQVIARCTQDTLVEIFRVVYELMADANQATHWCCKSMGNVKFADDLEADIQPFYIHLVRDGRDVASSFKQVAVGEKHIYYLAEYWKKMQESSIALVEKVGADRAITIRYEDLIQNPETTIASICRLVGLQYDSAVLEFFKSKESIHTADSGFMWKNVTQPIMRDNAKKYRSRLAVEEVEIFEKIAGQQLQQFGYALDFDAQSDDFTDADIQQFEKENIRMKKETLVQLHLQVDLQKRAEQELMVELIKLGEAEKELVLSV